MTEVTLNPTTDAWLTTQSTGLPKGWQACLAAEWQMDYMQGLKQFLQAEQAAGKTLYPPVAEVFNAFQLADLDQVRVVIIGQDPYHGVNQAHGLSFSVKPGVALPPSLQNIYKEISADLGVPMGRQGDLSAWAEQGVLLLNAVLTVEAHKAASHQGKGWERFTDRVIEVLNEQTEHLVFMLWGSYAHKKGAMIDDQKHLVLKAPHPSPLSAHRGFFGCRHFSKANLYLQQQGKPPIYWTL